MPFPIEKERCQNCGRLTCARTAAAGRCAHSRSGRLCWRGMCEAHMNDAIRKAFPVKKVTSSRRKGETVIFLCQN